MFLPGIFESHMDSLGFLVNILPNSTSPGLYGLAYTQSAADLLTVALTGIFAVMLRKEFKFKESEENNSEVQNKAKLASDGC